MYCVSIVYLWNFYDREKCKFSSLLIFLARSRSESELKSFYINYIVETEYENYEIGIEVAYPTATMYYFATAHVWYKLYSRFQL